MGLEEASSSGQPYEYWSKDPRVLFGFWVKSNVYGSYRTSAALPQDRLYNLKHSQTRRTKATLNGRLHWSVACLQHTQRSHFHRSYPRLS